VEPDADPELPPHAVMAMRTSPVTPAIFEVCESLMLDVMGRTYPS